MLRFSVFAFFALTVCSRWHPRPRRMISCVLAHDSFWCSVIDRIRNYLRIRNLESGTKACESETKTYEWGTKTCESETKPYESEIKPDEAETKTHESATTLKRPRNKKKKQTHTWGVSVKGKGNGVDGFVVKQDYWYWIATTTHNFKKQTQTFRLWVGDEGECRGWRDTRKFEKQTQTFRLWVGGEGEWCGWIWGQTRLPTPRSTRTCQEGGIFSKVLSDLPF